MGLNKTVVGIVDALRPLDQVTGDALGIEGLRVGLVARSSPFLSASKATVTRRTPAEPMMDS